MEINGKILCDNCFEAIAGEPCPICGFAHSSYQPDVGVLPVGTVLKGRYHIGKVLGKGGFGVTYKAFDAKEGILVAVKEYYPTGLAHRDRGTTQVSAGDATMAFDFESGAEKFCDEAKTISRFNGNPNIVGVHDYFQENGTAYFVMEYLDGMDLKHYIQMQGGKLTQENVMHIARVVSDALLITHSMNVLHRDISPDNIYITNDGQIKLIDFGAARQVLTQQSKSLSVILKQGFAPLEQYQRKGKQGAWTDIYALGATLYYALTGEVPDDATERLDEPDLGNPEDYGVDAELWAVINKCMAVRVSDRYKGAIDFKTDLNGLNIQETELERPKATQKPAAAQAAAPANDDRTVAMGAAQAPAGDRTVAINAAQVPVGDQTVAINAAQTPAGDQTVAINAAQTPAGDMTVAINAAQTAAPASDMTVAMNVPQGGSAASASPRGNIGETVAINANAAPPVQAQPQPQREKAAPQEITFDWGDEEVQHPRKKDTRPEIKFNWGDEPEEETSADAERGKAIDGKRIFNFISNLPLKMKWIGIAAAAVVALVGVIIVISANANKPKTYAWDTFWIGTGGKADKAKVGDIITMGRDSMFRDNWSSGEPLEWQVLDVQGDKLLLLSKYTLCDKFFDENAEYHRPAGWTNWEVSTIRTWLNGDFYQRTFSDIERVYIATTTLNNKSDWRKDDGNTNDRIFLLSVEEVNKYLPKEKDRKTRNLLEAKQNEAWLLRTVGYEMEALYEGKAQETYIETVRMKEGTYDVRLATAMSKFDREPTAGTSQIRPAMWVSVNQVNKYSSSQETTEPSGNGPAQAIAEPEKDNYGTGTITIWTTSWTTDFVQQQAERFLSENPSMSGYKIDVRTDDGHYSASRIGEDLEFDLIDGDAADLFYLYHAQVPTLAQRNMLTPIPESFADFITDANDPGSVAAVTYNGQIYGFPVAERVRSTILHYDKSVIKDPSSLEKILADCEKHGKKFQMLINEAEVQACFFLGTGCKIYYEAEERYSNVTGAELTYASQEGVQALKGLRNLKRSSVLDAHENGEGWDEINAKAAAVIGYSYWSDRIQDMYGSNYACAKLPTFTVDGKQYQMGCFGEYDFWGITPQSDPDKAYVCMALAQYFSDESGQLDRYAVVGSFTPTNKAAWKDEYVQKNQVAQAEIEQLFYGPVAPANGFSLWTLSYGCDILNSYADSNPSDKKLMELLEDYQDSIYELNNLKKVQSGQSSKPSSAGKSETSSKSSTTEKPASTSGSSEPSKPDKPDKPAGGGNGEEPKEPDKPDRPPQ